MTFSDLELSEPVQQAVAACGYETPTPIQAQAIPIVLQGRDMIGSAQTGTGKTAAFTLPAITRLNAHREDCGPRALILEPTRELAEQVDENLANYTQFTDLRRALLYGGVKYGRQLEQLEAKPDIVAATPGRLLDHLEQANVHFKDIEVLVLDEVDRMLDMGFIEQVSKIVKACREERQTLLFSATIPDQIARLANWALKDPATVDTGVRRAPAETVEHAIFPVLGMQKYDLLLALLRSFEYDSVLIFTRTKRDADRIAQWVMDHEHKVAVLHSDRTQGERKQALQAFKSGEIEIMVATDIASRGLDISGITHVINYNVPEHPEDYVHRIGRTGRAAKEGEAYTLFSSEEAGHLAAIERYLGQPLERRKLEGFRYRIEPDLASGSAVTDRPRRRNRGFSGSR
ncbi:MAG: DEAD/DEAH box helicase [Opitutales bacterium]